MNNQRVHFIAQGHIGNQLEELADEPTQAVPCEHKQYCALPKYSMKCVFGQSGCQAKKFYDKYGNTPMFVGSN